MEFKVTLSKDTRWTPSSLLRYEGFLDDEDFIQDPDMFWDSLPQPYRMINKIVENLLSDTLELIKEKEQHEIAVNTKILPPKYDCASICDLEGKSPVCLDITLDGQYVFVGIMQGLVVMSCATGLVVSRWLHNESATMFIKCFTLFSNIYLVLLIDDNGVAKLLSYTNSKFHLIKSFDQEIASMKTNITSGDAPSYPEYLILVRENPSTEETYLEVYKLPVEMWVKEFDAMMTSINSKKSQLLRTLKEAKSSESTNVSTASNVSGSVSSLFIEDDHPELLTIEESLKLSPVQLFMKISPASKHTYHTINASQACKLLDTGEILGHGLTHLISQNSIDSRKAMYAYFNKDINVPSSKSHIAPRGDPTFHFMRQGNFTVTSDPILDNNHVASLLVWWTNEQFLYQYSLLKTPPKDLEQKPDMVIPHLHPITYTAISPCSTLLAVGLENGCVTVWDTYSGLIRGVVDLECDVKVTYCEFISPSLCSNKKNNKNPNSLDQVFLLTVCDKSKLFLVSIGPGYDQLNVLPICDSVQDENGQNMTLVSPVIQLPNIVIRIERNGIIYLQDITRCTIICQLCLPTTHELSSPWQPKMAATADSKSLYFIGKMKRELGQSLDDIGTDCNHLLLYQLGFIPSLDIYWCTAGPVLPFATHRTLIEQTDALFTQRIMDQTAQKARMQERWYGFEEELSHKTAR